MEENRHRLLDGWMKTQIVRSTKRKTYQFMACMCCFFVLFFWFLCLSISQYSSAQMHRHTQATHSGYGERCQCAPVHLNRAGVLPLQYTHTHTHTRQTQSSTSKPDRFDMLSFSIPKGEEMCVCLFHLYIIS